MRLLAGVVVLSLAVGSYQEVYYGWLVLGAGLMLSKLVQRHII